MHELELILGLFVAVTALAALAARLKVPYPILLVIGGLALGLIPGLPHIVLEPEHVFLLFLPPILFSAAYFTDWRAFVANRRPIGLLAVGAVLTTTVVVAVVAHALIDGLSWSVAFALGAIVSPPDAVATVAIVQRLGVRRRIVTILEGESLVNDATALVAYRFAVAAVVTGSFSLWSAIPRFVVVAIGGVAVGVVVGFILVWLIPRLHDPTVEIAATLLAPVAAFLPAEELGVSGVLATVTAGLIFGRRAPVLLSPAARLRGVAVWEFVVFLVNGLAFILIGLQLPTVLDALREQRSPAGTIGVALVLCLTTILIRIAWVFPATYLPRWLFPRLRRLDPAPPWSAPAIVSWAGLRGVVTLAAALALPLETDAGTPFPDRDLVLFLSFCVILVTLVGQGLTLPLLVSRLGAADDGVGEREETLARREATLAAITRLDALRGEDWVPIESADALRARYEHRLEHFSADDVESDGDHLASHDRLRREILLAERRALLGLRDTGRIGDEVMHRVEYDLDLAEARTEE